MTAESVIRFRSAGIELDGLIAVVPGATKACVVCHPHPLYGGDMRSGVVVAVTEALRAAGVSTLRFDFRGVGSSGGVHANGVGEIDDARAAVDALAAATGLAEVAIAGYSFGSLIALRVASTTRVQAAIAIAPPLAMFDSDFITAIEAPTFLLAGERDDYCPAAAFAALARRLPGHAKAVTLAGADHFFAGREREVAAAVSSWYDGL